MEQTALRELIDATPACVLSASLASVLSCCDRSRSDQVVIVDEQHRPIGLLRLGRLLLKLAVPAPAAVGAVAEPVCSQAIATGDVRSAADLFEPLRLFPLSATLAELGQAADAPCALVDAQGCYWGLVDRLRVLQRWASHTQANPILSTWENLISQLPIPLMLQTSDGEAIAQNMLWQPEVEPDLVRRIAIAVMPPAEPLWLAVQDCRLEANLELAAKNADLVQLNRLKDEFLACISHELKSPLTAILGLSSLLKDPSIGGLSDRQVRYAQLIHQSGRHLSQIVHNILDLTRCETGQLSLTPEPVAIASACHRAYEQARQVVLGEIKADQPADLDEPKFELAIAPDVETIVADELRLRQMLTHLLSNALKFTPSGEVKLTVELWDGWIVFTVADTGIGIAADQQHLIFQKFQQLENPLTRRFAGTGLGLAITQRLAHLHGGEVSFRSIEGQGSRFTLLLPPAPPLPAVRPRSPRLALMVESPPQIAHLSDQLERLGYRVAVARSGPEAIAKARRLQPAVILLNPILPLLSGWDVLTLLKTNAETRQIPAIVMATEADRSRAHQHKASGFLTLPIEPAALRQVLPALSPAKAASNLTILHVRLGRSQDLSRAVYPCRLLEVDDIEQANMLARVWRPDAIVLDVDVESLGGGGAFALSELSQHPALRTLPIVTLTAAITQAANQIAGLSVFPCLTPISEEAENPLLQVLHVATERVAMPRLLLADLLPDAAAQPIERLGAIAQHLQAAGFDSTVSRTWRETIEHIDSRSIDLLLLWLPPQADVPSEQITTLMQLQPPPVLLLHDPIALPAACETVMRLTNAAIVTLPATAPMSELVAQIRQAIVPCLA
ncbi:response regulator [Microcoleus sp. FACHB-1515]|uniref:ATP-binding response regulator n=1 Tax=Cyanophyceae TaxID=3028117 RepID=UPI001685D0FD|nr:ATP-binding protein [Microcoleus sp. FACHB-1515]MBD2091590.1 response regulator [Microcoleus sp. FACHB-1515]